ncbi:FAD-binding protein [Streptomyces jumonjinensis]|uniref:FAD-dependent oxidoreductase n=1 Tax=Streptomyces jumonjinensis TaxID=1945 RepID=A0A646KRG1_STRJU|nr:FAD-binding protein [Streptomyces jumonjinensis]MQT04690.1 FAD-dependent oxidoreductase [Streptomyces jumonjinensis]
MTAPDERYAGFDLPGEAAYDEARQVFNLHAPVSPAATVTARTADEVRAAVRLAGERGLAVRVQSTGHGSATARPMDGALLIRTRIREPVAVDVRRRVARVSAGTLWGAVVEAAAPHGLAAAHGSSPTVGVVGYLLRGGLSFYGRSAGLAVNTVRAVELVTADGELRRADPESDPDLFWALRGGGGGFGVVTAVEFALFPVAKVVTGAAFWPVAEAPGLLEQWRRWTEDAPREATTAMRVMNLPKLPELPSVLTQGPVLCLDGVVTAETAGDLARAERQAAELLGPLRAAAAPLLDDWRVADVSDVPATHLDPPDPVPVHGDHLLLGELGTEGVAAFLRAVDRPGTALVVGELRQLGGALAEPDPAGGALSALEARYAYSGSGVPIGETTEKAIDEHTAQVRAALAPWDTGRTAPTFVATTGQPQCHLDADAVRAVDAVRLRVDPRGMFRGDIDRGSSALA